MVMFKEENLSFLVLAMMVMQILYDLFILLQFLKEVRASSFGDLNYVTQTKEEPYLEWLIVEMDQFMLDLF